MSIKLKKLTVKNFKCFASEKSFDFNKITILTGGNSSGKSSVLHAVLGSVQSGEFPFKLSPNGKYINMGDFKEMSNKHKLEDIHLGFVFKHKNLKFDLDFHTIWGQSPDSILPTLKELKVTTIHTFFLLKKKSSHYTLSFTYDPKKDPHFDISNVEDAKQRMMSRLFREAELKTDKDKRIFERNIKRQQKYIESAFKKVSIKEAIVQKLEDLEAVVARKNNLNLNYTLEGLIGNFWSFYGIVINGISSFRLHPDRTYLERTSDKSKVDKFGDGYLDQIIQWEKNNPDKFKKLLEIMRDELSLLTNIRTNRKMGGGRFEVLVKTTKNGTETSLFDVGFGINQFLPIIVADLQLREGSTLFVAEPEIHLHPNVQAKFGDYLAKQVSEQKKNYVIETHSEYLLNRIRLLVSQKKIKETDLSVYYLENKGTDVEVHKIKFGLKGEIEGAPDSFFDTYLMDIKDIALNALK